MTGDKSVNAPISPVIIFFAFLILSFGFLDKIL